MKKNDWILIVAAGLYSFLFYGQTAGINFVIFSFCLICLSAIKDNGLLKNKYWHIAALGSLLTACCIGWYGNSLSVIGNIVSLSLLSALAVSPRPSVITALLNAFYSYFSAPLFMILDKMERQKARNSSGARVSSTKVWLVIIPVLITFLFFFMYRASNPLFNDFSKKINFDFISPGWILFTLGGIVLMVGWFYPHKVKFVSDLEEKLTVKPVSSIDSVFNLFGKAIGIEDEYFSGKILFILLNALLLIVNLLDVNFLYLGGQLPTGVTYSDFVHQGIGALITSIIIAIAIILFYFRGALNFYKKRPVLKYLAYFWIIQNVFMLISTAFRNDLYINEYGLTFKRIGVTVYLFLAAAGLLTTFIKIWKVKSNYFLLQSNGWIFYVVLTVSCLFNWTLIVTHYNLNYSRLVDKNYLLELGDSNLNAHFLMKSDSLSGFKEGKEQVGKYGAVNILEYQDALNRYREGLSKKVFDFMNAQQYKNWQSWNHEDALVHKELLNLNRLKKINEFQLSHTGIKSLKPLRELNNITGLYLKSCDIRDISELFYFPALNTVDLSENKLFHLNGIAKLKDLQVLNLSGNNIWDYSPLYSLDKLKELRVSQSIEAKQYEELQQRLPNTRVIKN